MRWIATLSVVLALGAGVMSVVCKSPPEAGPAADIDALASLAGAWTGSDGKLEMEEVWMAPKGGHMLGLHRDVVGERMVSFEFLRISTGPAAIAYIAMPNAANPTVFPLKELEDKRVVFENLKHDFPKRILYWLDGEGALHARIEGDGTEPEKAKEWKWTRAAGTAK